MLYVLNSFSVNLITKLIDEMTEVHLVFREIDENEVKELLRENDYISAIGHEGMSSFLSQRLNVEIPFNRVFVSLNKEDSAIVAQLVGSRLPEGSILSREELEKIGVKFYLVKVA